MKIRLIQSAAVAALLLAVVPWASGLELVRQTIDGGGSTNSTGGDLSLSGTLGQFDAGTSTGGDLELTGGFWFAEPSGDCNADGSVDLLDLAEAVDCWSGPSGGLVVPECNCLDFDFDGDVDLRDFSDLQVFFTE